MSVKLSNCFLLLAVGLLLLFAPTISKAQNKSALCESGFEMRWGWKHVWKYVYTNGKTERDYVLDYVYDCFPKVTEDKSANSTDKNSVNRNSPKVMLSTKDRLPEQLGEFKRVKLSEVDSIFIRDNAEEEWEANYQINKDLVANIELSRYIDSASAIKAKDSKTSGFKSSILNKSLTNQAGQGVGELVICKAEGDGGIAFLRHNNYLYLIVAKDKIFLEKILKNLPID